MLGVKWGKRDLNWMGAGITSSQAALRNLQGIAQVSQSSEDQVA